MDKKFIIVLVALVLSVTCTIGVTLAWLTSKPAPVVNTFTVGDVVITLDEQDIDNDAKTEDNVTVNGVVRDLANEYHLIPGSDYVKDPTVHVQENSEACYVFVTVDNQLKDIVDGKDTYAEGDAAETVYTIEAQLLKNGWMEHQTGVYYKEVSKDDAKAGTDLVVFSSFVVKSDVSDEALEAYAGKTITVTAYAIQSSGLDVATAWTNVQAAAN